jgi:nitroreductase
MRCQHCLAVCPKAAVSVDGASPEKSLPLDEAGALPTEAQMRRLAHGRRSVRQYRDEDADPRLVARLLDDLAYAPTGRNPRTLGMRVIDSREIMDRFREKMLDVCRGKAAEKTLFPLAAQAVGEWENGRDLILRGAPHALAIFAPSNAPCPQEDVVLALAYFELLANAAGLGTTWCGLLKWMLESAPELKAAFGLPADGVVYYTMLFGVPDVRFARTVQRAWPDGAVKRVVL